MWVNYFVNAKNGELLDVLCWCHDQEVNVTWEEAIMSCAWRVRQVALTSISDWVLLPSHGSREHQNKVGVVGPRRLLDFPWPTHWQLHTLFPGLWLGTLLHGVLEHKVEQGMKGILGRANTHILGRAEKLELSGERLWELISV
jgi:hypothetical protein